MRERYAEQVRRAAREAAARGPEAMEELAWRADLSVTTLLRFIEDGDLSTAALLRLTKAMREALPEYAPASSN